LAHRVGNSRFAESIQLVWVDRQGTTIEQLADTRLYRGIDLAPDQRRLAFHEDEGTGGDVWVMDLARGTSSRLTFDGPAQHTGAPAWSPDGTTIAYVTERNGTFALRAKAADGSGSESLLVESPNLMSEIAWSPDGRAVVYQSLSDIWALPVGGTPFVFHGSGGTDGHPQVSPDGRWLAYDSDETGRPAVYIRPFPKGAGKWMVSTGGGGYPRWRGDSRELYYDSVVRGPRGGDLMSVELRASGVLLEFSAARRLFASGSASPGPDGLGDVTPYAVARDGQRFLIPRAPSAAPASPAIQDAISVIVNWPTLLNAASTRPQ
jgi:Tol biopolymer transport system component